jgi:HAD superfamily hydrolase (TIGR01509 family)
VKLEAVIFDLYGVLALNGWQAFKAHHFSEREDVWEQVFQLGRQVDAGLANYDALIRFTAEQTGESEATVRYQLEHTLANDELLAYIATELKPHYKLGILSNASSSKVIRQVFAPEQVALFDTITLSHHTGLTKPDSRMYEAAAAKLDVLVEACLFVDDQERHVTGAREAGMQALVYTDVPALRQKIGQVS